MARQGKSNVEKVRASIDAVPSELLRDANANGVAHRRVLIIAYYFPPMGLSGVQRVAKFVKYLPRYGWHPTVLTVEPAGYFAYDESQLQEVSADNIAIKRSSSWDPTRLFGTEQTVRLPAESRRKWMSALSQFIFLPDNKIGWMPHALKMGRKILEAEKYDAIFSTAPPYTAHLIAAKLSRQYHVPLTVDFRDDWVQNPRHVYPTNFHARINRSMERFVLSQSACTVTINDAIKRSLEARSRVYNVSTQVQVIPQGFDAEDFSCDYPHNKTGKLRFLYSGIFYDAQTPDYFLRALSHLVEKRPAIRGEIEARFVGLLPDDSKKLARELGIADLIHHCGYLNHDQVVAELKAADILWMTIGRRPGANGISTGKLFEYFGARKPILALIPEGEARKALKPYSASIVVEPDDVDAIRDALALYHEKWRKGGFEKPDEGYVRTYDRCLLTGRLANVFNEHCQVR